jgi:type VI secretion system secreted protein VgrG
MTDVSLSIDGRRVDEPIHAASVVQAVGTHSRYEVELQTTPRPLPPGAPAKAAVEARRKEAEAVVTAWAGKPFELMFRGEKEKATYRGVVTRLVLQPGSVLLSGRSPSYLLDITPRTRSFRDKTITEIVEAVLGDYKKKAPKVAAAYTGAAASPKVPFLAQYQETDFEFLTRLASYEGCLIYDDRTALVIRAGPPKGIAVKLAPAALPAGGGSVTVEPLPFAAEAVACGLDPSKPAKVKVTKLDGAATAGSFTKLACDSAGALFGGCRAVVYDATVCKPSELQTLLKTRGRETGAGMVEYRFATSNPTARLGTLVELIDQPFASAPLFVAAATAEWTHEGYLSDILCVPAPLAAGPAIRPLRPFEALLTAIVTDLNDPEKVGRVRVKFPWTQQAGEPWARLIGAAAGKMHGSYWSPAVGDEVVIGFEFGDPSRPLVLGSLYNKPAPPPVPTAKAATELVLAKTVRGTEIRLIDAKDKEEVIVIMDGGRNELRLKLGPNPEVIVKTEGKCTVEAKTLSVTGSESLELSGGEVTVSATKGLTLNSKGNVVVKGKKIKLN